MQGEVNNGSPFLITIIKVSSYTCLTEDTFRIKVMQSLYAFKGTESDDLKKDEKFLLTV